ncbi:MAG: ATP-binding cassette domain-containing protein [Marinifilaceae bacterium]|nr:ATP-binding cassette domain-containing protein [Marinifilaceae bacterium]
MRIVVERAEPRFPEFRFKEQVSWIMEHGQNWAVIGPNGAGKSLFADLLQGKVALRSGSVKFFDESEVEQFGVVRSLTFRDIHSLTDSKNMYYQQRWNSQDADEAPVAAELLSHFSQEKIEEYTKLFGIYGLLERRIISLSSGELRKFLITRVLMSEPKVLILDNPFIGLDAASRKSLDSMLSHLYEQKGLQVILVLSQTKDLPGWITNVLPVKDMTLLQSCTREEFFAQNPDAVTLPIAEQLFSDSYRDVASPIYENSELPYADVVEMHDVVVKYAGQVILKDVDWRVQKGEKWALLGGNGSGKSTLLSLVCGDNPQAYANNMSLFGRRRGTGESIWDIKRRIGYLSPDIHTYYMEDIPCLKVVASGFFDSVGLFRKCTEEQIAKAKEWMRCFGADYLMERSFVKISYGEQRLVLLVRAFVKNPELLILDEPLHGLDTGKKRLAKQIIEQFCSNPEKTLIYVSHYEEEIPACVTKRKLLTRSCD